jgi:hypothetical protein
LFNSGVVRTVDPVESRIGRTVDEWCDATSPKPKPVGFPKPKTTGLIAFVFLCGVSSEYESSSS